MSVQVIIRFKTLQGKRDAFADLLRSVKRSLPAVDGCKEVKVFLGNECPDSFTMVETWTSESAHQAHLASVIASGGWAHVMSHLASEPQRGYFREMQ